MARAERHNGGQAAHKHCANQPEKEYRMMETIPLRALVQLVEGGADLVQMITSIVHLQLLGQLLVQIQMTILGHQLFLDLLQCLAMLFL